jgi:hypothetical protein
MTAIDTQTPPATATGRKEPKEVALELAAQHLEVAAARATTYEVSLTSDDGYFMLNWKVDGPIGSTDWVGLYVNSKVPDSDYTGGNNWQWATKDDSYKTATATQAGFQARYLVWDAKAGKYVSVARSAPWKEE